MNRTVKLLAAVLSSLLMFASAFPLHAEKKPSVLICSPQGASYGWVDLTYLNELHEKGFEVDYTEGLNDVTWDRIKNYNALVIYVTPDALEVTNRAQKPSEERIRSFVELIDKYVSSGGGVFLMPTEANIVKQAVSDLTSQWGAKLPVEIITETDKGKIGRLLHSCYDIPLAWTDQIMPSPVSQGVKQIWYSIQPAYNAQQTGPIVVDENWKVVVKGSKTSLTKPFDLKKSTSPELENPFSRPDGVKEPDLFAIRDYKGGRIALMNQWRQFSIGSGTKYIFDRQVLSKGFGERPSDFGKLLENTFRWLAEPSLRNNAVGGYVTPPERLLPPNEDPKVKKDYADRVWPYDPAALGTFKLPAHRKIFKGLLGAKTSYSSGKGTVEEYAKAAEAAGLDFLVFMDDFSALTPDKLKQLAADCKKSSNDKVELIPGFSIMNNIGNHMFFYSPDPVWIPDYCLTGPNKDILYIQQVDDKDKSKFTGYLTPFLDWVLGAYHVEKGQVGYYNFSASPNGMRMWDLRLYGMAGVRYYKDGKLVEDNTEAYLNTVPCTIPPAPASVNEVSSPEELKREVANGNALIYAEGNSLNSLFMEALRWTHQYDAPNFFMSDGPRVVAWPGCFRYIPLGSEDFVVGLSVMPSPLSVTSEKGIKEIRLYNGRDLYRRFLPNGAKEFTQILVLEANIQKNIVMIAEDIDGKKAVAFARRCWKDGALAPTFCSDHVNDGPMALAHGPYAYQLIRHPALPDDIAGDTWDGGPLASVPLTGYQNTLPTLDSDKGKEEGIRFDQIPLLEFSDDGAVAVSSERKDVFDEKVVNVVNPWHTYGPIAGPSKLMEYTQRYREFVRPTVANPRTGWAGPGVRMGTNAALFRQEIKFKDDMKVKSLNLGYLTGNKDGFFVISGDIAPMFFDLGQPGSNETIKLKKGDWFGYYNTKVSNANLFFNRGETLRVTNRSPYMFFDAELDNQDVKKGQLYVHEIAGIGFPVNVEIKSPADLMRYVRYIKDPAGMQIKRGKRADGAGLVEFAPDEKFVLEIAVPKPSPRLDLTLPCRLLNLNPRWSAGLFQKQGYCKGDYGTGENRYRALGTDWTGTAYIPLYVDYADMTHVLAGHPVIAGPEGKDLFIQITHVAEKPDKWHLSVNNPTDQPVKTKLMKTMDLPGLTLEDTEITLQPGEYKVIL